MSVIQPRHIYRLEKKRELTHEEADNNFKLVADEWDEYRQYYLNEIVYHLDAISEDEEESKNKITISGNFSSAYDGAFQDPIDQLSIDVSVTPGVKGTITKYTYNWYYCRYDQATKGEWIPSEWQIIGGTGEGATAIPNSFGSINGISAGTSDDQRNFAITGGNGISVTNSNRGIVLDCDLWHGKRQYKDCKVININNLQTDTNQLIHTTNGLLNTYPTFLIKHYKDETTKTFNINYVIDKNVDPQNYPYGIEHTLIIYNDGEEQFNVQVNSALYISDENTIRTRISGNSKTPQIDLAANESNFIKDADYITNGDPYSSWCEVYYVPAGDFIYLEYILYPENEGNKIKYHFNINNVYHLPYIPGQGSGSKDSGDSDSEYENGPVYDPKFNDLIKVNNKDLWNTWEEWNSAPITEEMSQKTLKRLKSRYHSDDPEDYEYSGTKGWIPKMNEFGRIEGAEGERGEEPDTMLEWEYWANEEVEA